MLRELRFARFWLFGGLIAALAAFVVCILPAPMVELPGANDKVEHMLGYVLLTLWFCGIYPRSKYWIIAVAYLAFGVSIELVQGAMNWGRHADLKDVYADASGIVVGLLLGLTPLRRWPLWLEAWVPRKSSR